MKVRVKKKPVHRVEQARKCVKVFYDGIHLNGKKYSFLPIEDIWKYVGCMVEVEGNSVYSQSGDYLGEIFIIPDHNPLQDHESKFLPDYQ